MSTWFKYKNKLSFLKQKSKNTFQVLKNYSKEWRFSSILTNIRLFQFCFYNILDLFSFYSDIMQNDEQ